MYMEIAFKVAQYSVAEPFKVGCVIVKTDDSLTIGLNGTPSGWETNVCEYEIQRGPVYMVSKLIEDTNALIDRLENEKRH